MVGHNVNVKVASEGDDWETDPDFEVHSSFMSFYPGNHLIFNISTTTTFILNSSDDQYRLYNLCRLGFSST